MKYLVDVLCDMVYTVLVEADNEENAGDKAIEKLYYERKVDIGELGFVGKPEEAYVYDENGCELI